MWFIVPPDRVSEFGRGLDQGTVEQIRNKERFLLYDRATKEIDVVDPIVFDTDDPLVTVQGRLVVGPKMTENINALFMTTSRGFDRLIDSIANIYDTQRRRGDTPHEAEEHVFNRIHELSDVPFSLHLPFAPSGVDSGNTICYNYRMVPSLLNKWHDLLNGCLGYIGDIEFSYWTSFEVTDLTTALDSYVITKRFVHPTRPVRFLGCTLGHEEYSVYMSSHDRGHANFLFWDLQLDRLFWIEPHGSNTVKPKTYYLESNPYIVEQIVSVFVSTVVEAYRHIEDLSLRPSIRRHLPSGIVNLTSTTHQAWRSFVDNEVFFLSHVDSNFSPGLGLQAYLTQDVGYCVSISLVTYYLLVSNCASLQSPEDYVKLLTTILLVLTETDHLDGYVASVANGLSNIALQEGSEIPEV